MIKTGLGILLIIPFILMFAVLVVASWDLYGPFFLIAGAVVIGLVALGSGSKE